MIKYERERSERMSKNNNVKPVLKWVGGKRQLLDDIKPFIPKHITTYIEPFIGGAAVLFELQPTKAIINDYNTDLINVYEVIKEDLENLLTLLEEHNLNNSEKHFYEVRSWDRDEYQYSQLSRVEKAARIIYLNKTCFNGLYRVNSKGEFNTPYGKYENPNIVNEVRLRAVSEYLNDNNIKIMNEDYTEALKYQRKGSFVYLDPPYMPISETSAFTSYTENGFDLEEQIRLKKVCDNLDKRGISFLQSNSDTPFIRDLYKDYNIKTIRAKRSINSKGNGRGEINEVLIYNYDETN